MEKFIPAWPVFTGLVAGLVTFYADKAGSWKWLLVVIGCLIPVITQLVSDGVQGYLVAKNDPKVTVTLETVNDRAFSVKLRKLPGAEVQSVAVTLHVAGRIRYGIDDFPSTVRRKTEAVLTGPNTTGVVGRLDITVDDWAANSKAMDLKFVRSPLTDEDEKIIGLLEGRQKNTMTTAHVLYRWAYDGKPQPAKSVWVSLVDGNDAPSLKTVHLAAGIGQLGTPSGDVAANMVTAVDAIGAPATRVALLPQDLDAAGAATDEAKVDLVITAHYRDGFAVSSPTKVDATDSLATILHRLLQQANRQHERADHLSENTKEYVFFDWNLNCLPPDLVARKVPAPRAVIAVALSENQTTTDVASLLRANMGRAKPEERR